LLVQQFFPVEKYATFLDEHFVPLRVDIDSDAGEGIAERYGINSYPSTVVASPDGSLIDILTRYRGNPDRYLQRLQDALDEKGTYASIKATYDENPDDLRNIFALANKHADMWQMDKTTALSAKILERADEAKTLDVPFQGTTINLYEVARFGVAFGRLFDEESPQGFEAFRREFPQSMLIDEVYSQLARAYLRLPLSEESDTFFDDLKNTYLENPNMLSQFVRYCTRTGENLEEGEMLARKIVAWRPESSGYRQNAVNLLLKAGKENEALDIYGEAYISDYLDDPGALNSYAWFWAMREKNLTSALASIQRAFEVNPKDDNLLDTMSMVYWKMKEYEKAIGTEERAYAMNPNPGYLERIKQIEEDMTNVQIN
jgi:tetratricopeptide (TPR) repeat protein